MHLGVFTKDGAYLQVLAKSMRLDIVDCVWEYVRVANDQYHKSENQSAFAREDYAIDVATISSKRLKKNLGIDHCENTSKKIVNGIYKRLHTFILKRVKRIGIVLYAELGSKTKRLHFHGAIYGSVYAVDKIKSWWSRNIGYVKINPINNPIKWHEYASKDAADPDSLRCYGTLKGLKMLKVSQEEGKTA